MVKVTFKYRDKYNYPNWSKQSGIFETALECMEWYGLGVDCEYEIISIEEV